jgi:hypothetical protein
MPKGWTDEGVCSKCQQRIYTTEYGNIVGHLSNCPNKPKQ